MASAWTSAARLVLQQYGAPTIVAGGCIVAAHRPDLRKEGISSGVPASCDYSRCEGFKERLGELRGRSGNVDTPDEPGVQATGSAGAASSDNIRRRMTRVGRFSLLSETKNNPSVPVMVMCLSGQPWTAKDFTTLYHDRQIDQKHERFRSYVDPKDPYHFVARQLPNPDTTQESGRSLPVNDIMAYPQVYRNELKSMITDALMTPMDLNSSLWQAWVATGGKLGQSGAISKGEAASITSADNNSSIGTNSPTKENKRTESLLLFRAHHCMADGVSLGTIFGDLTDEGEEIRALIAKKVQAYFGKNKKGKKKKPWWKRLAMLLYYWCWGSIRALGYQLKLFFYNLLLAPPSPWKLLQAKAAANDSDKDNQEEECVARSLSWVSIASVHEVKEVAEFFSSQTQQSQSSASKKEGSKVTINDIFCSCITGAIVKLIRYHQNMNPELDLRLPHLNLVIPVHMQGGVLLPGQSMGNKIGAMVSQLPALPETSDTAIASISGCDHLTSESANTVEGRRLMEVHNILWDRKQTPAAVLSFLVAKVMGGPVGSLIGSWTSWLFEKAHGNASVVVTNVRGSERESHLGGRRVEGTLGFIPLPPGIPIGMVVMSYNQSITLTIMAEPWAVPDADLFLSWVVEEYQALLNQAKTSRTSARTAAAA